MKILIIQLARLGDIYMSWPAVRALKRKYPYAEIHFLCRPKFSTALEGLNEVSKIWQLPTAEVLEPLVSEGDVQLSLGKLEEFLEEMKRSDFDQIINFTFSPLSSYLAHFLETPQTKTLGYTRFSDGYLCPNDSISSYFYAQVGIGKDNRIHLVDLFATLSEVELADCDWSIPEFELENHYLPDKYCVFHIGASEAHKVLSPDQWNKIVKDFLIGNPDQYAVIIGTQAERIYMDSILNNGDTTRIVDLVGKTKVRDLFPIIREADFLIGCDSAPMHIASITNTPTFNISSNTVNFWETGPKADFSYIYLVNQINALSCERVSEVLNYLINGIVSDELIVRSPGLSSYVYKNSNYDKRVFGWKLVKALYFAEKYPVCNDINFIKVCEQLNEINELCISTLTKINIKDPQKEFAVLDGADNLINEIHRIYPDVGPIIRWFQTERVLIPPGDTQFLLRQTLDVHLRLRQAIKPYILEKVGELDGQV